MSTQLPKKTIFFIRLGIFIVNVVLLIGILQIPRLYWHYTAVNELNVHLFADVIVPEVFYEFEKETGIKVKINYFVSDEELLAKLRIDRGVGSDLITISDRNAEIMIQEGILQKIDRTKITEIAAMDKRLTSLFTSQANEYALPFSWTPVGLGYNKKFFGGSLPYCSWRMVFNPPFEQDADSQNTVAMGDEYAQGIKAAQYKKNNIDWMRHPKAYKFCTFEDRLDTFLIAGIYLFNTTTELFKDEQAAIQALLMKQKKWVEIYTSANTEYYLQADIVPLLVTNSALMKNLVEKNEAYGFVVPQEGSLVTVLNFAIPATSKNVVLVHKLISFLWSKKISLKNFKDYGYNPANSNAYVEIEDKFLKDQSFFPDDIHFKKLHLACNQVLSIKDLARVWLAVKSV